MNRNRIVTARKNRVWSATPFTLVLTAVGVAGQQRAFLSTALETTLGRSVRKGDTLSRAFLQGTIRQSAAGDVSFQVNMSVGIGWYAASIDAQDYPDVQSHEGDWPLHGVASFGEPAAIGMVNGPGGGGAYSWESKAQRTAPGTGFTLFCVMQTNTVPSAGTYVFEGIFNGLFLVGA